MASSDQTGVRSTRRRAAGCIAVVALAAVALTSCGAATGARSRTAQVTAHAQEASTLRQLSAEPRVAASRSGITKLLVVVMENHSETHALTGMPRLAALAKTYGYADNYSAVTHPSLPNYLAIAGGSSFGVTDDASPQAHRLPGPSIFDQAISRGFTAKTYAESMTRNCQAQAAGTYAVKHNPWTYFADSRSHANCLADDVPAGTTASGRLQRDAAAGTLPTVGLLVPNICNDAHDCALATADTWLGSWLTMIRQGPDWRSGKLAVVITFDEDDYSQANHVLTVVMAPAVHHLVVTQALNHFSITLLASQLTGNAGLGRASTARSLRGVFPI